MFVLKFDSEIEAYENKDLAANITAKKIIPKIVGNHRYLFNFALLRTNLEFEMVSQGFNHYSIDAVNIAGMNADTILNYDYIIINKAFDRTKNLHPIFKTPYYHIYKPHLQKKTGQSDRPEFYY